MKSGVVTSAVLHTAVLTWGLWTFSSPKPLDASYAEALPVEIVMSDVFQGVKGEKKAPVTEKPAPKPTSKPQKLPMPAENVGDNEADLDTPPTPDKTLNRTPQTGAKKPASQPKVDPAPPVKEKVAEAPPPEPEPKPEPVKEEAPAKPEKPKETTPKIDPMAEMIAKAEAEPTPDDQPKPDPSRKNVPVPHTKPRPPEPVKVAEAKPQEPKKETPRKVSSEKPDVAEDDAPASDADFEAMAAAAINKQKAAGGGAKRSTEMASLGSKKTTGATLSRGEKDALIQQLNGCWRYDAGGEDGLRTVVTFNLTPDGHLDGAPVISQTSGKRSFDESARRAVQKCDREGFILPANNGDGWDSFEVTFDPENMTGY